MEIRQQRGATVISSRKALTLDDFICKPLTRRTERFVKLCEFYTSTTGKDPESGYQVFEFVHDCKLPFELRHFKLFSEDQIISYFWKWQRITKKVG
jgi:hypothetical protein